MQLVLSEQQIEQKINRLAHEVIENCYGEQHVFIGGIKGNGSVLAEKIATIVKNSSDLQVTSYIISLDKEQPLSGTIDCSIDTKEFIGKTVVLTDDVINSGSTMQYAVMKILEAPVKSVKTVALVDRTHRRFPIKCDFVGISLTTTLKDRVEIMDNNGKTEAYLV